jgi:hypothetical protein
MRKETRGGDIMISTKFKISKPKEVALKESKQIPDRARRKFILKDFPFFSTLIVSFLYTSRLFSDETKNTKEDNISFSWVSAQNDKDELVKLLKSNHAKIYSDSKVYVPSNPEEAESSEFAPLVYIVGAIAVAYLADVIINLVQDVNYNGLIAHVKNGKLEMKESASLNRGEVLFIDAEGKPHKFTFNKESKVDIISAIKSLSRR